MENQWQNREASSLLIVIVAVLGIACSGDSHELKNDPAYQAKIAKEKAEAAAEALRKKEEK